jgi:hypothetical protein
MSVNPLKADIRQRIEHVCLVPQGGHQPSTIQRGRYSLDQTVPVWWAVENRPSTASVI